MSWDKPFEAGHRIALALMYQPFRIGQSYQSVGETSSGSGYLGSDTTLSQKTTKNTDGIAEKIRFEGVSVLGGRLWNGAFDATHAGVVAGNKNEIGAEIGTNILTDLKWKTSLAFRKPVEGPVPFLYQGTPGNMGAVEASPRGPESPFTVNWDNREATFLTNTFWFDPTPGNEMFLYDPTELSGWNVNPEESAPFSVALQHRMKDYPTTTDRQYYYDQFGNVVWEPASHSGAWATDHPINEFKVLGIARQKTWGWALGVAGGQSLAVSGIAYSTSTATNKPITDYFSIEGKLDFGAWNFWGHYGTGVWGPEPNIHPFWGYSFDRIWGLGGRYSITKNTTIDLNYLAAHQTDDMFVATSLGSYDEIRAVFSHRFGFLFNFQKAARAGYRA